MLIPEIDEYAGWSDEEKFSDKGWRMNNLYFIKTKNKRLLPMKLNKAQRDYLSKRGLMNFILKARQLGFSTFCLIDLLDDTVFNKNTTSAIVAHKQKTVTSLFEIVKRAFNNLPPKLKPRVSFDNRAELFFPDIDSKIYVTMDTRGETVHNLHVSELAFIRNAEDSLAATLESVPQGGKITFETTANGMGGYAYEEWEDKESDSKKFFYNWLWEPEYTLETKKTMAELETEYRPLAMKYGLMLDIVSKFKLSKGQLAFYISKVKRHKELVVQEYPTTDLEAFISSGSNVFHITDLQKHTALAPIDRKWSDLLIWEQPLKGFQYVLGVDSSEGLGGDNSVIEVMNANTGEQVAEFAVNNVKPDILATYVIQIAKYYNRAFVVIEINSSGISVVDHVKKTYSNLYRREIFDKRSMTTTESLGWRTTGVTKPLLVNALEEAVREEYIVVNSEDTLKEMKAFVRTEGAGQDGYGAESGHHDDRVIALGLAYQGLKFMPRMKIPETLAQKTMREYIEQKTAITANAPMGNQPMNIRNKQKYLIRGSKLST